MKKSILIGALALALTAGQATAAGFLAKNISMDTNYVVDLTNPNGVTTRVYDNIQLITTAENEIIRFLCIDMFHSNTLGLQDPVRVYAIGELTTDFGGNVLSDDQKGQLGWFWRSMMSTNDHFQWAALQGAAWIVEGGSIDFRGNVALEAATNAWVLDTNRVDPDAVRGILSLDGRQSGVTVVPEPTAWALMILGFGAAGGMLRRERRRLQSV